MGNTRKLALTTKLVSSPLEGHSCGMTDFSIHGEGTTHAVSELVVVAQYYILHTHFLKTARLNLTMTRLEDIIVDHVANRLCSGIGSVRASFRIEYKVVYGNFFLTDRVEIIFRKLSLFVLGWSHTQSQNQFSGLS